MGLMAALAVIRRDGGLASARLRALPAVWLNKDSKTLISGAGSGRGILRIAETFGSNGTIRSARMGSTRQIRCSHHHHHHHPQQRRKLIWNAPLASVTAQPTWLSLIHHHHQSTSYEHTVAPGTGLPSAHTSRPVIVYSRHHHHHHHQK